jgi:hypothetical protein
MSIVEGTLLQRIENEYLERAAPSEDFKRQSSYFYMTGDVIFTPENRWGHAFIMSSATGNIIEATYDPEWGVSPYIRNKDPSMGFEDFLMNRPFVGTRLRTC